MNTETLLELRLRQVDLRFVLPDPEAHVPDERLALFAGGLDPEENEAAHLAACDACLDLLVALAEGLESLAGDAALGMAPVLDAGRVAMPSGRTAAPAGRQRRFGVVLGGLGFAFAAAAAVGVQQYREAPPTVETPAVVPPAEPRPVSPQAAPTPVVAPVSAAALAAPVSAAPAPEPVAAATPEPARPRPPAVARTTAPATPAPGPGAVATSVGEVSDRDAATFGRAPVNAPGRGFGFLRLSATPQAQVFIDDRPFGWTPLFDLRLAEGPHDIRLVYAHPDAAQPEERFRVVIPAEEHWVVKRKNLRATPP